MRNSLTDYWKFGPNKKTWITPITPTHNGDKGDYIVTLPDDLISQMGWKLGDTLEWVDGKDGSFIVRKVD